MFPTSHKGPLVLVNGTADASDLQLAARLTARFSQGKDDEEVTVAVCNGQGGEQLVTVRPMPPAEIPGDWYL